MTPATALDARGELQALLASRIPLVVIETHDEPRALEILASLALRPPGAAYTPVFQWTVTEGLRRLDIDLGGAQKHNAEPTDVLISHQLTLPRELEHFAARFQLAFPNRTERQAIVEKVAQEWARSHAGSKVRTDRKALELLIENLGGLCSGDTDHVLHEIQATRPLSVVMAEKIAGLRAWAAERTVAAD